MKLKYIPYGRQCLDDSDIKEVVRVLKSEWLTQGPKVKGFERGIAKRTGAKYAVAVSSGTAALHIACLAAGITKGDEVITSPITFVASSNAVLYCQATPIFADIQSDIINIDPKEIKKKVSNKTKAIIPIHFAGHPCDMKEIYAIARRHNLIVIEDAAHALGAKYRNSRIGSCKYSDMTTFSFHPVKNITTGEGGVITTNKKNLYRKLLMLRGHGITKEKKELKKWDGSWHYEQQHLGFNYRITDFQCALGISQLKKLDRFMKRRKEIAAIYNNELSGIKNIILPTEKEYVKHSWHIYCIQVKDYSRRKEIFDRLRKAGIGVQVHYLPVHLQPYYKKNLGYKKGDYKRAENYYKRTITLPCYPGINDKEVKYVVQVLKKLL